MENSFLLGLLKIEHYLVYYENRASSHLKGGFYGL